MKVYCPTGKETFDFVTPEETTKSTLSRCRTTTSESVSSFVAIASFTAQGSETATDLRILKSKVPTAFPYFSPTTFCTTGTTSRPLSFIASNSSLIASRRTSLSRFLFAATNGFLAFWWSRSPSPSTVVQGFWFARIQPKKTGVPI